MPRDIDRILDELRLRHSDIRHERLTVAHAGADDNGLWFFRAAESSVEVQLESPSGNCPFLAPILRRLGYGSRAI
jgi:hypothetical protein